MKKSQKITLEKYKELIYSHQLGEYFDLTINNKNIDSYSIKEFKDILKQFKKTKHRLNSIKMLYFILYSIILTFSLGVIIILSVMIPIMYTIVMDNTNQSNTVDIILVGTVFLLLEFINGLAFIFKKYDIEYHLKKALIVFLKRKHNIFYEQYEKGFFDNKYECIKLNKLENKKIYFLKKYVQSDPIKLNKNRYYSYFNKNIKN